MLKYNKMTEKEISFLQQSNYIEGETSSQALDDAVLAWSYAVGYDEITLHMILSIHGLLMSTLNPRIAGKLRDCNVRVGRRVCPDHTLVSGLMNEWVKRHANAKTVEEIVTAHASFELIHPFEDGNGRTGRIIMNWQLLKKGHNIFVINEEDRFEYYKWFNKEEAFNSKDWEFIQGKD